MFDHIFCFIIIIKSMNILSHISMYFFYYYYLLTSINILGQILIFSVLNKSILISLSCILIFFQFQSRI